MPKRDILVLKVFLLPKRKLTNPAVSTLKNAAGERGKMQTYSLRANLHFSLPSKMCKRNIGSSVFCGDDVFLQDGIGFCGYVLQGSNGHMKDATTLHCKLFECYHNM